MSALGYDRCMVHGDDLGGGVAVRLATDFPDRVSAIHTGPYGAAGAVHLLAAANPLTAALERDERRWSDTQGATRRLPETAPDTAISVRDAWRLRGSQGWLAEPHAVPSVLPPSGLSAICSGDPPLRSGPLR